MAQEVLRPRSAENVLRPRCEEPTLLVETAGFTKELRPDPTAVKLVSLNAATAQDIEVTVPLEQGAPVLSLGRADTNTAILADQRVSYKHFLLRVRMRPEEKENAAAVPGLELVDLSTNGTWVNNYKVGKGKIVPVHPGDEIQILPVTKVGRAQTIGFVLQADIGEPATREGVPERPKWVASDPDERAASPHFKKSGVLELGVVRPVSKDDSLLACRLSTFATELEQEVTCGICADILHKCVALIPCLHNFCTACYLEWRHRSNDCPNCRAQVVTILRNHAIDGVVSTFLKAHPSRRREATELADLDKKEEDPLNRLLMNRLLSRRVVPDHIARQRAVRDRPVRDPTRDRRPPSPATSRLCSVQ